QRVDHRLRLQRRRAAIEVGERLAIDGLTQRREGRRPSIEIRRQRRVSEYRRRDERACGDGWQEFTAVRGHSAPRIVVVTIYNVVCYTYITNGAAPRNTGFLARAGLQSAGEECQPAGGRVETAAAVWGDRAAGRRSSAAAHAGQRR